MFSVIIFILTIMFAIITQIYGCSIILAYVCGILVSSIAWTVDDYENQSKKCKE